MGWGSGEAALIANVAVQQHVERLCNAEDVRRWVQEAGRGGGKATLVTLALLRSNTLSACAAGQT